MYVKKQDMAVTFDTYVSVNGNSAHMSFNQINCRVIENSFNIFVRINNNFFFPLITGLELIF